MSDALENNRPQRLQNNEANADEAEVAGRDEACYDGEHRQRKQLSANGFERSPNGTGSCLRL